MTPWDLVVTPTGLRFRGQHFPCTIGRGGVTSTKREGDGATPAGDHGILGVLYRLDRMRPPVAHAAPIRPNDLWCDDPAHPQYNQMARAPLAASAERLARADPLYDLILLTDWNGPKATPGAGSAIFIHRWRRPGAPTEGCIGLDPRHLLAITRALRPTSRLIVRPYP